MAINLIDTVKGFLTPDIIQKASTMLGESESGVTKALGGIAPAVLGGMLTSASSEGGASRLVGMLTQGNHSSLLDNVAGIFGGGSTGAATSQSGQGMLSGLFGDKLGALSGAVASFSGLKESSATTLMSLAAPLVAGVVGRQAATTGGLNAGSLVSLLTSQKDHIMAALPAGLGSLLGLGAVGSSAFPNLGKTGEDVRATTRNVVNEVENKGPNWLPWLLGLGGILVLLFLLSRSCGKKEPNAAVVTDTVRNEAPAADTTAAAPMAPAAPESIKVKLADGTEIDAYRGSLEDNMVAYLNDASAGVDKNKWFSFAGLNFDTGKETLQPGEASTRQLTNVAAILKAYPKVKIKIGGYTDNTGDSTSNVKLSEARAKTVASELVKIGASKGQITGTEGYGPQYPEGDNATEEGRAKNRRIAISVREK